MRFIILLLASAYTATSLRAQSPVEPPQDGSRAQLTEPRVPVPDAARSEKEAALARMNAKIEGIILPVVSFDSIRLADVIEVLRRESVQRDAKSSLEQRGVKITVPPLPVDTSPAVPILGLPAAAAPSPILPDIPITLHLDHPTLAQALGAVAEKIGRKLKVDPDGVQLVVCCVDCQLMITREFRLLTVFLRSKASMMMTADATEYLKSCGIQLPLGASVQYVPATQKLIVCNTQENIDLIEAIIASLVASANGTALLK